MQLVEKSPRNGEFKQSFPEKPNHLQDKDLGGTPPRGVGGGLRGTGSGGNLLWGSMRDHGRGIRNLEPRWYHRTGPTSLLHAPNSIRQFSRPLRTSGRWVKVRRDAVTARLSDSLRSTGSHSPPRPPASKNDRESPADRRDQESRRIPRTPTRGFWTGSVVSQCDCASERR